MHCIQSDDLRRSTWSARQAIPCSSKDPDFASRFQREQGMIQAAYQQMNDTRHVKTYLEKCDQEIQQHYFLVFYRENLFGILRLLLQMKMTFPQQCHSLCS